MKAIKLTILGVLLSIFSYGQDTIRKMVAGKNLNVFDLNDTYIVSSTDFNHENDYVDYRINILENEVLLLHLYDDCKYCTDTITTRNIEYLGRITNTVHYENVKSSSNIYYVDGSYIKSVTVKKPN